MLPSNLCQSNTHVTDNCRDLQSLDEYFEKISFKVEENNNDNASAIHGHGDEY